MGAILTQEQFDREAGFRLSLSIMNRLMEESLLTPKEYGQIVGTYFWNRGSEEASQKIKQEFEKIINEKLRERGLQ